MAQDDYGRGGWAHGDRWEGQPGGGRGRGPDWRGESGGYGRGAGYGRERHAGERDWRGIGGGGSDAWRDGYDRITGPESEWGAGYGGGYGRSGGYGERGGGRWDRGQWSGAPPESDADVEDASVGHDGGGHRFDQRDDWSSTGSDHGGYGYDTGYARPRQRWSFAGLGPRNYRRRDERIEEDVCEALTRHPGVDATDVEVRVRDGEVTLAGTVADRRQKRLAEAAAERCPGVIDLHNEIRVARAGERPPADREVRRGTSREGTGE